MKIRVQRIEDGPARVETIDSSDGAVARTIDLNVGEEVTIDCPTASSPADIEVGAVTRTNDGEPETEAAEGAQDTASTAEAAEEAVSGSGRTQRPDEGKKAVSEPDAA